MQIHLYLLTLHECIQSVLVPLQDADCLGMVGPICLVGSAHFGTVIQKDATNPLFAGTQSIKKCPLRTDLISTGGTAYLDASSMSRLREQ